MQIKKKKKFGSKHGIPAEMAGWLQTSMQLHEIRCPLLHLHVLLLLLRWRLSQSAMCCLAQPASRRGPPFPLVQPVPPKFGKSSHLLSSPVSSTCSSPLGLLGSVECAPTERRRGLPGQNAQRLQKVKGRLMLQSAQCVAAFCSVQRAAQGFSSLFVQVFLANPKPTSKAKHSGSPFSPASLIHIIQYCRPSLSRYLLSRKSSNSPALSAILALYCFSCLHLPHTFSKQLWSPGCARHYSRCQRQNDGYYTPSHLKKSII